MHETMTPEVFWTLFIVLWSTVAVIWYRERKKD